ncbi:hypothetical protein [Nonomuraea sp. NPDC049695]
MPVRPEVDAGHQNGHGREIFDRGLDMSFDDMAARAGGFFSWDGTVTPW